MDYSEFFTGNSDEVENFSQTKQEQPSSESIDNASSMTIQDVSAIFQRLNGWDEITGKSKIALSYQLFAMDDPEDAISRNQVFSTCKPAIQMCFDTHIPGYFGLDIIFRSANEPELKLLWGRMQQFRRNIATHPEKEWILFFNIIESSTITLRTDVEDTPFVIRAFNPLMAYLTREIPEMQVGDTETAEGEMVGGNIIRMVIPAEFVQFEYCRDIDTLGAKGEVLAEEEEARFINNQNQEGQSW